MTQAALIPAQVERDHHTSEETSGTTGTRLGCIRDGRELRRGDLPSRLRVLEGLDRYPAICGPDTRSAVTVLSEDVELVEGRDDRRPDQVRTTAQLTDNSRHRDLTPTPGARLHIVRFRSIAHERPSSHLDRRAS